MRNRNFAVFAENPGEIAAVSAGKYSAAAKLHALRRCVTQLRALVAIGALIAYWPLLTQIFDGLDITARNRL